MQRCPCCNARLQEAASCPRCKADLQKIMRAQQAAGILLRNALTYYLNDDRQACVDALNRSLQLYHMDSAALFRGFVLAQKAVPPEPESLQLMLQNLLISLKIFVDRLLHELKVWLDAFWLPLKDKLGAVINENFRFLWDK